MYKKCYIFVVKNNFFYNFNLQPTLYYCRDKVANEFKQLGNEITVETLKQNQNLTLCIKETVRMHTQLFLLREALRDVTISNYSIPKGSTILLLPAMIHRNEKVYESPNEWKPERFIDKNYGFQFIQWGFNLHRCLGEFYAYAIIRFVVASLVSKFEMSLDEKQLPEPIGDKVTGMPPPNKETFISIKVRQ